MTYGQAILLGFVQGVAEFLPISSSGHLAVLQNFLAIGDMENHLLFDVLLHLGTLAAVFLALRGEISPLWNEGLRMLHLKKTRRGEKPDGPQNQFATLPDLLLIDGGKGQVGAVKQALRGTALEHVPTFGMVKDDHHRTRAIVDDEGGEIAINRNRNIFTFVTNIQDETHRYANDYRKRAMKKKSYAATLTAIPGVGEKTSAALLAHFKTVAAVKAASISDLEEVKGISHAKAEMLYNALRNGV